MKAIGKGAILLIAFALAGTATIYLSNSYLSIFWRISRCDWHQPGDNFIMAACGAVVPSIYRVGELYLDIDARLTNGLRAADVVVTGNSTTIDTFVTRPFDNLLERHFKEKGLKLFVAAEEGSGFRLRKLLFEKLDVHPRIALIDTEDVAADLLTSAGRDIVLQPDRFKWPFEVIHFAIGLQHAICAGSGEFLRPLQSFYCHGDLQPVWRNVDTGILMLDYPRLPIKRQPVVDFPDTRMATIELFRRRAEIMLSSPSLKDSCIIYYEVPSPNGFYEVSRTLAHDIGRPFIFPPIGPEKQYYVYDGSHTEVDTAERWTNEFLPLLDPAIDNCLNRKGPS